MVTSKRTEICKQVRQAKKDDLIEKYAIDENGRIFVLSGLICLWHQLIQKENLIFLKQNKTNFKKKNANQFENNEM